MVGFLQIIIYLLCIYLVYKAIEIFQIAFVSPVEGRARKFGMLLGGVLIIGAFIAGISAVVASEFMAEHMNRSFQDLPRSLPKLNIP